MQVFCPNFIYKKYKTVVYARYAYKIIHILYVSGPDVAVLLSDFSAKGSGFKPWSRPRSILVKVPSVHNCLKRRSGQLLAKNILVTVNPTMITRLGYMATVTGIQLIYRRPCTTLPQTKQ